MCMHLAFGYQFLFFGGNGRPLDMESIVNVARISIKKKSTGNDIFFFLYILKT